MSQFEDPRRLAADHEVTLDDLHALLAPSTPHFALQLSVRIRRLIADLPADHPVRAQGERELARLRQVAFGGEVRGFPASDGLTPLASVSADAPRRHVP